MKVCPKCNSEHDKKGTFCSRRCANSRVFTEDTKKLKSDISKRYWNNLTDEQKQEKIDVVRKLSINKSNEYVEWLLYLDWDTLSIQSKRYRVILEQNGKCNRCGLSHWQELPLTLEYEHIDGNNKNNDRDNVECLCPNCHSLTPTWRGRKNSISRRNSKIIRYLSRRDSIS